MFKSPLHEPSPLPPIIFLAIVATRYNVDLGFVIFVLGLFWNDLRPGSVKRAP